MQYLLLIFLDILISSSSIQVNEFKNIQMKLLQNAEPVLESDSNCTILRDDLADAISNFTLCAIEHARPITLCESCVDTYISVQDCYKNLTDTKSENGYCIDEYANMDRLQIVNTLYQNTYELWSRAKCYECFEIINKTLTHNRSEETLMFNSLLNDTLHCINDTANNQSIFCTECVEQYLGLNEYYKSISNINEKIGVCMDIVDLMNGTRAMWGKQCCEYRKKPEYIFLGSTAGVTLVTIIFYILAKFCTDMKKPAIFYQSRFAESLTQISD